MTLALVRHGAIRYKVQKGDKTSTRTAFRGMTVDLPESEYERLEGSGAVIPSDGELPRDGEMMPLPNTASDEELIAWVSVASKDEITAQVAATPHLADRILTARDAVTEKLRQQNDILGGVDDAITEGLEQAAEREQAGDPDNDENPSPESGGDDTNTDGPGLPPDDAHFDEVVSQSVAKVSEYLSENPERASLVLDAENRRVARGDGKPPHVREGVIAAVQAAAAHN